jgi:endonuclease/exonuclease/phosphatase (EEP) superfamily protein YafD
MTPAHGIDDARRARRWTSGAVLTTTCLVTGLAASVVAGLALAARYLPITNHIVLLTATLSPYLMLGGAVSVVLLLLARRWLLASAAIGLTVATLVVQLPLYRGSGTATTAGVGPGTGLRVLSVNIREGQADPEFLVRSARERADVVAFQELTSKEVDRLSAAGLDATFPYRWLDPRGAASGVGVWSRLPMHSTQRIEGYANAFITARIQVTGVPIDPTVVVAHIAGPWPQPIDDWRHDFDRLPVTLQQVAEQTGRGCVIVAGDFNSTTDMRPFRALLRNGYDDAAEQSGAGFAPTFPGDSRLPPLIAIDHVLTRGCAATSLRTITVPGSDHRGLVTTVAIPH